MKYIAILTTKTSTLSPIKFEKAKEIRMYFQKLYGAQLPETDNVHLFEEEFNKIFGHRNIRLDIFADRDCSNISGQY